MVITSHGVKSVVGESDGLALARVQRCLQYPGLHRPAQRPCVDPGRQARQARLRLARHGGRDRYGSEQPLQHEYYVDEVMYQRALNRAKTEALLMRRLIDSGCAVVAGMGNECVFR